MDRPRLRGHRRGRDDDPGAEGCGDRRGILKAAGTPGPLVDRLSKALETALATSDIREKLDIAGCEAKSAPRAQFADIIKTDVALWAKVVKDAGITAD
jgi:tripartite-type tricarboxylate transporter receptor subunit TctC